MSAQAAIISEKACAALQALAGATKYRPLPASSVARVLWPERLKDCGTSLRRGGLYRAAGAFCSKLQRQGLVAFYMDDFERGYYLTEAGRQALVVAKSQRIEPTAAQHTTTQQRARSRMSVLPPLDPRYYNEEGEMLGHQPVPMNNTLEDVRWCSVCGGHPNDPIHQPGWTP